MNNKDIEQLSKQLNNSKDINTLSTITNKINLALDKSINIAYKAIFDYYFSNYLYQNYIVDNKTKGMIAEELGISQSSVYYYIHKYNLKKDPAMKKIRVVESMKKTCQEKYGVNFITELPHVHRKKKNQDE